MADGPEAPKQQEEVAPAKAEVDVIVPPTELVVSMAAYAYTREQVLELIKNIDEAKAKGLTVRFA